MYLSSTISPFCRARARDAAAQRSVGVPRNNWARWAIHSHRHKRWHARLNIVTVCKSSCSEMHQHGQPSILRVALRAPTDMYPSPTVEYNYCIPQEYDPQSPRASRLSVDFSQRSACRYGHHKNGSEMVRVIRISTVMIHYNLDLISFTVTSATIIPSLL